MLEEETKRQIKSLIRKHLSDPEYKAFFFGSRVTKKNLRWSDIDIGILGMKKIPGHVMVQIKGELEDSNIPYKIDVVDFKNVSEQFRDHALKQIEYL